VVSLSSATPCVNNTGKRLFTLPNPRIKKWLKRLTSTNSDKSDDDEDLATSETTNPHPDQSASSSPSSASVFAINQAVNTDAIPKINRIQMVAQLRKRGIDYKQAKTDQDLRHLLLLQPPR